jgi:hypothetical protein
MKIVHFLLDYIEYIIGINLKNQQQNSSILIRFNNY